MRTFILRIGLLAVSLSPACGSSSAAYPDVPQGHADSPPLDAGPAPTYTELFARYFAPGTPGHCATSGCHADPGHNEWLCGTNKDDCYRGMVSVGLIDPVHPERSMIADPSTSPLTWINPAGGNMPFDTLGSNPSGRDAITAWVAAGARND